jgi:DNA-binding CsgD family transcriptional regulator
VYQQLARSAGDDLSLEELDDLGTAAYLTGRAEEAYGHWTRAHQAAVGAGLPVDAVRFGARLASTLGILGDIGRASGWAERTRRLVEESSLDCVEIGYLDHAAATCRIFESGDAAGARAQFVRARKTGERFGDRELVALARMSEGRCAIYLGDIADGLTLLDEAMVAVEAGDVSVINAGDAYCTVIDGCHELFDLRRSRAWSESFDRWCDRQPGIVLYRGQCLMDRAHEMLLHGRWDDGAAEATAACERLAEPLNLLTIGRAHYIEGEYRRLRGELEPAQVAYGQANVHGCEPQPGLALLRAAQGDRAAADATIRRVVAEAAGPIARAPLLAAYVEIVLAAGDVSAAAVGASELDEVATTLGSAYLAAQAACADGAVRLADGDAAGALTPLRRAHRSFSDLEAPYDAARTRVLIADACTALGDADGATLERDAARAAFESLRAGPDLASLDRATRPAELPGGLTEREVEILSLIAAGMTNRSIAGELSVSEKTVASHVTHILTKLGLPSRAAATAYAYDHGLITPSPRRT